MYSLAYKFWYQENKENSTDMDSLEFKTKVFSNYYSATKLKHLALSESNNIFLKDSELYFWWWNKLQLWFFFLFWKISGNFMKTAMQWRSQHDMLFNGNQNIESKRVNYS